MSCGAPLTVADEKLGLCCVDREEGKLSRTEFERVCYVAATEDGVDDFSIVRCFPRTGRSHQIRVHLLHMGYPIANDPAYRIPHVPPHEWSVAVAARAIAAARTDRRTTGDALGERSQQEARSVRFCFFFVPAAPQPAYCLCHTADRICPRAMILFELTSLQRPFPCIRMPWHFVFVARSLGVCYRLNRPMDSECLYLHAVRYAAVDGSWCYETQAPHWVPP